MPDRDQIFADVTAALKAVPAEEKTPYPEWDAGLVRSRKAPEEALRARPDRLWEHFKERFSAVHGDPLDSLEEIPEFLRARECRRGFVDPGLVPQMNRALERSPVKLEMLGEFHREQANDYDFGITRAEGLIAESGTIILKDRLSASRLGVLAPWLHLAIVPHDNIYPTIAEAIAAFDDDPHITFVTGPSKTADVEGILIEGVHGPGIQAVCRS